MQAAAGCGKTFLGVALQLYGATKQRVVLPLASSNRAALTVGGKTLHSYFGIRPHFANNAVNHSCWTRQRDCARAPRRRRRVRRLHRNATDRRSTIQHRMQGAYRFNIDIEQHGRNAD